MKSKKYAAAFLSAMLAVSLFLTGCDTYDNFLAEFFEKSEQKETTVRIGVFEPLTGPDADEAEEEVRGIELAHELFPEVLGFPVELVYADNQSDVQAAVQAAQSLADQDVSVVLGSYKSVLTLAGSDIFAQAKIPAIGITCANPIITQTSDYYFRVCYVDAFQGNSVAKYVLEHLNFTSAVALQKRGDDFAGAMIEQFAGKMTRTTGDPDAVTILEYPENTEDFTPYFEAIRATSASAIFFPSEAEQANEVLYQASLGAYDFQWIGIEDWARLPEVNLDPLRDSQVYLNGVAYIIGFDDTAAGLTEMTETFLRAYREKYGEEEKPTQATALGFDAYLLAIRAIEDAGTYTQGTMIAGKISSVFEMPGATGSITLNAQGDPIKEVVIERFFKDQPRPVFTSVPVWGQ
jgi:branched-chain amino acid transport system substrate-binding protein